MLRKMRPPLKNPLPRAKLSVSAVKLRRKCSDFRPTEVILHRNTHHRKSATGDSQEGVFDARERGISAS